MTITNVKCFCGDFFARSNQKSDWEEISRDAEINSRLTSKEVPKGKIGDGTNSLEFSERSALNHSFAPDDLGKQEIT